MKVIDANRLEPSGWNFQNIKDVRPGMAKGIVSFDDVVYFASPLNAAQCHMLLSGTVK